MYSGDLETKDVSMENETFYVEIDGESIELKEKILESGKRMSEIMIPVIANAEFSEFKENLKSTKLTEEARLLGMDVFRAIPLLEAEGRAFDIIFMDPPYDKELEKQVLVRLADSCLVDEQTLLVVEASLQTDFSYLEELGFEVFREKKYKNNRHMFIQTLENEPA